MQHFYAAGRAFFVRAQLLPVVISPFLIAAGCIERPTTIDTSPDRPHAGVVLTAAASDPADREVLRQLGLAWSVRSGARVHVLDEPWDGNADIGLIAPAEISRWAEAGQLIAAPPSLTTPTHPYRWDDLYTVYAQRLTHWRERTVALPILGEGMVLAYRTDAFDGLEGRPASPPATWDELVALAGKHFNGPYLPPVPPTSERLLAEFFVAAACYDRPAVGRLTPGVVPTQDFFTFQFDRETGEPRLDRPSFRYVAELFRKMRNYRGRDVDAAAAFRSGEAKVGIISLAELGRVGPDLAEKLGVAQLPGAHFTFDSNGEKRPTDQETVNRVPFLGWGGRVGVVSTKCRAPSAAWDFVIDAGLPERTALDLIAAPQLGTGPYRASQLDVRSRPRWFAYGLSAIETERLTTALRDNLGQGVQNIRLRVRTPNQHELAAALDDELRTMLKDQTPVEEAMAKANHRWKQIIDKKPRKEWIADVEASLGLEAKR